MRAFKNRKQKQISHLLIPYFRKRKSMVEQTVFMGPKSILIVKRDMVTSLHPPDAKFQKHLPLVCFSIQNSIFNQY